MKTTKIFYIIIISISFFLSYANAQLQVSADGLVKSLNQTAIFSNTNRIGDVVDILGDNPSLPNGADLIWGKFRSLQPNNPGLLTLQSMEGANFTVRANGNVGIFNSNPSCALEIGTLGTNYEIKVNGSIVLTSDERVKKNINSIENSIEKLKKLKSVSYNFTGVEEDNTKDITTNIIGGVEKSIFKPQNNKKNYGRTYYGFLAQDVQKLFPDLVYKDSAGILGVDYIGMIPLLVNALNEQEITIATQNEKIVDLESRLSKLENNSNNSSAQRIGANGTTTETTTLSYPKLDQNTPNPLNTSTITETNTLSYPILEQNTPNPFNTSTTIGFYLPNSIMSANIYIYDMNGGQLKNYSINERGKGFVTINGSEFKAGMYLYALIADGKVTDTKRMILTK